MPKAHGLLEIAQPVAEALDVENATVVQESVEDGRRQHLVAGEDFGSGIDALVGRVQQCALLVAVRDETEEEERCLLTGHGLEADLIEYQQARIDVPLAAQGAGSKVGVASHQRQEVVEAVEYRAGLENLDTRVSLKVRLVRRSQGKSLQSEEVTLGCEL
ncbi:MAG: hypothetical protein RLO46_19215 [Pseudomonadales bacterium]